MFVVGGILAIVYGIVLFSFVNDLKKKRLEAESAPLPGSFASALLPRNPAQNEMPPRDVAAKDATPKKEATPGPTPKEPPKPAPGNPAQKGAAKPAAPPKATEPKKAAPAPVAPPAPPAPPPVENWRGLTGTPRDCPFHIDGPVLTVSVPGKLHLLNPEAGLRNSPFLLTAVHGDFVAQVRVTGQVRPGTEPLGDFPFPPFQGGGLLLWQDENNYLRLERTSMYSPADGKRFHQVMLELCRDGKTQPGVFRDARDFDIILKFDRRGSEVRCSYSSNDGRDWLEVKRQPVNFPPDMKVGISASNASPRPFAARFEGWELSGPGSKPGKGM
jgi:regulation of enolase protein 1 (concanavalin A-like superfamily)